MVLVWPNCFVLDHNDLVLTKMKWSWPKWIGLVQIVIFYQNESQFGPDQFILVVTISFWSWPNHYGQVQINLVRPKPFWTDQNCFGHIEGQGIRIFYPNGKKAPKYVFTSMYLRRKNTNFKGHFQEIVLVVCKARAGLLYRVPKK